MSQTEEVFKGNSYEVIAFANDQRSLLYQQFGSYQGEWIMLTKNGHYSLYKGWYGSCSGCDSFEGEFGWASEDGGITKERAKAFAKDYRSFAEIPKSTMRNLVKNRTLQKVFPGNIRDDSEIDYPNFINDCMVIVKLEEGLELSHLDIIGCRNQEVKQKALKKFGYERFMSEVKSGEEVAKDGENSLVKIDDIVFLALKDSSTNRRYLLRVPPEFGRDGSDVRSAIAWTFGLRSRAEYSPLIET